MRLHSIMVNKWKWKILLKKPKIGIRLLPNKIVATTLQSKASKEELVSEYKIECLTIGKFCTP